MKTDFLRSRCTLLGLLATTAVLAGCTGLTRLDTAVQTFTPSPGRVTAPYTYRFERLPSQLPGGTAPLPPQQLTLVEDTARQALARVGMQQNEAAPRYSVQLEARITRQPGFSDPWYGPWGGYGWRSPYYGGRFGWGPPMYAEPPSYRRDVAVIVRELPANQVVYETRAAFSGYWSDEATTLTALFDAALAGFPNPPAGPRRVIVDILPPQPATVQSVAPQPAVVAPAPAASAPR